MSAYWTSGYLQVLSGDTSPPLQSPAQIDHDHLPSRDSQGNYIWYYIEHFTDPNAPNLANKSIVRMEDTSPEPGTPRKYKFLTPEGSVNPVRYTLRDTDRVYKCKYPKCQREGEVEQQGGRKKRYSATRSQKKNCKKMRKNTRKSK